jgi:hypothetical protein
MALSFSIHTRDEPDMDFIKELLEAYNFGVIDHIHQTTKYKPYEDTHDRFDVRYSSINEKGERLKQNLHTKIELIYGQGLNGALMYSITPTDSM